MARNGSGAYIPPAASFPAVAATLIESTKFNNVINDIGTALTASIANDGQTTILNNLPMAGHKLTGLSAGTAAGDSVRFEDAVLLTGKDATGGYVGMTLFKINFKNAANTFTNFFTNTTTAARTYTFQDRDGTVADNTDLALKEATANKDATGGYVGLTAFKINFKNVANTFTSFFTNTNTAARTYTFPDKDGNVAMMSDVSGGGVRQTVRLGTVDANGFSNFGGSTGSTTVTAADTLNVTAAQGITDRPGTIVNPSWTGLSTNGTMYLYLDVAADGTCTTASSTLAPAYIAGGTPSVTSGQFTFDYTKMTGYLGNGSTAPATYRLAIGEVTVAGGVVTAIAWYALNGKYRAVPVAATGLSTTNNWAHNIGTPNVKFDFYLKNTIAEIGYSIGDMVTPVMTNGSSIYRPMVVQQLLGNYSLNANSITGDTAALVVPNKTGAGGGTIAITTANWNQFVIGNRGW